MRYGLVGLFCLSMIAGCNSDEGASGNQISNEVDDNSGNNGGADAYVGEDSGADVNYNQMSCTDDLKTVLALINEKRKQAQMCGNELYGPVDELTWSGLLTSAAQSHSNNMANYDFFSHTGLDGSTIGTRVTDQGYTWSYVAENIAAGQSTVESVVNGWMASAGHCKNIMSENVTEMGLACSANSDASYHYYWTQVFAKAR
ncbi:CAP domain-containing protein [uncultured Shewanella sp.]|uniref:CAP domain-containing protein n=1 Tax=uncultured Shewanella sp. TaxID=173975 RepID=UPI00261C7276|nr:CAP domain-containing protein [uncultured Shewanella sp.]